MTRDFAIYRFEVKEGEPSRSGADDAPTSLYCQPEDSELSIVGKGHLSINFKKGVDLQKAKEIALLLQSTVLNVSFHP